MHAPLFSKNSSKLTLIFYQEKTQKKPFIELMCLDFSFTDFIEVGFSFFCFLTVLQRNVALKIYTRFIGKSFLSVRKGPKLIF